MLSWKAAVLMIVTCNVEVNALWYRMIVIGQEMFCLSLSAITFYSALQVSFLMMWVKQVIHRHVLQY